MGDVDLAEAAARLLRRRRDDAQPVHERRPERLLRRLGDRRRPRGSPRSTIGSETAGSIILPSYINSAVGIKPTRGLVSRGGVIPLLPQNDTGGPIDQNVTDAAEMLGLMTGVDPRDP